MSSGRSAETVQAAREAFTERVLRIVESVPPGSATSYGAVADHLLLLGVGRGGPRQVGAVMARDGGGVPWWRVVRADGRLPERLRARARRHYLAEGTPLVGGLEGEVRVDLAAAWWQPTTSPTS